MGLEIITLPWKRDTKGYHRPLRINGSISHSKNDTYSFGINYRESRFKKDSKDLAYLQHLQSQIVGKVNSILSDNNESLRLLVSEYNKITEEYQNKIKDISLKAESILNAEYHDISQLFKKEKKKIMDEEQVDSPSTFYTYILKLDGSNLYKIGMSKDIRKRMQQYCNESHTLIAVKDDNIEGLIKYVYDGKRVYGSEEYRFTEKEINAIIDSYHFRRV